MQSPIMVPTIRETPLKSVSPLFNLGPLSEEADPMDPVVDLRSSEDDFGVFPAKLTIPKEFRG